MTTTQHRRTMHGNMSHDENMSMLHVSQSWLNIK